MTINPNLAPAFAPAKSPYLTHKLPDMRPFVFLLSLLFSLSPLSAQNYQGNQEDIDQIIANAKAFSGYLMAGDLEGVLNSYTADGKIFPNNLPIMEGRESLAKYWAPSPGYRTLHHQVTAIELVVTGDEARDYGHYEGRSVGPDGKERSWQGKYVIIWKKEDGEWKMYLDIWNASPEDQ